MPHLTKKPPGTRLIRAANPRKGPGDASRGQRPPGPGRTASSLTALWPINDGQLVAVAGGGGKTGLIELVESELFYLGRPAIVTVTTRLSRDQLPGLEAVEAGGLDGALAAARLALAGHRVLLARRSRDEPGEPGLYHGIDPSWLPRLRAEAGPRTIWLVEADGSAGRPLKAHRSDEPVLPPPPRSLIMVLGALALTLPFSQSVHRPEIYELHQPLPETDRPLTPEEIARHAELAWKPLAPDLILLNQLDAIETPETASKAAALGRLLTGAGFKVIGASLRWRMFKEMA